MHVYIHIYIHTNIHTYIHTYTHTYRSLGKVIDIKIHIFVDDVTRRKLNTQNIFNIEGELHFIYRCLGNGSNVGYNLYLFKVELHVFTYIVTDRLQQQQVETRVEN